MPKVPDENRIEYYWNLVQNEEKNPTRYLVNFYLDLFGLSSPLTDDYKTIGKVVQIFGKNRTFVAILDYFRSTERNVYGTMYQALLAICRNSFIRNVNMETPSIASYTPLDDYLKERRKLNAKLRKLKKAPPSSDGRLD